MYHRPQCFLPESVIKNNTQDPKITNATTINIAWVFHPLCTSAARRLYLTIVLTYVANPLTRHARARTQNTRPSGNAIFFSRALGESWRWKDIMIAHATIARYTERRSHERKVRSFAQWSRASEEVFSNSNGPQRGFMRKRWFGSETCLGWMLVIFLSSCCFGMDGGFRI